MADSITMENLRKDWDSVMVNITDLTQHGKKFCWNLTKIIKGMFEEKYEKITFRIVDNPAKGRKKAREITYIRFERPELNFLLINLLYLKFHGRISITLVKNAQMYDIPNRILEAAEMPDEIQKLSDGVEVDQETAASIRTFFEAQIKKYQIEGDNLDGEEEEN